MLHEIDERRHGPMGPEMADAVSTCVHCGFCLAACPTYREFGQEADSPRGRIVLMKEVLEGRMSVEDAAPHIDRCLGCLACEPACPSGVPYRDLISPFRAVTEPKRRRSLQERIRRSLVQRTLPYPTRMRLAALGRYAKPLRRILPPKLRPMLDLLPAKLPSAQIWPSVNPAKGTRRGRVALLTGCAQSVLDPDINTATINVLTRNGIEVLVPKQQTCCGALSWHVGNLEQARAFALKNLTAFPQDVDAIITNAAGCGSGMHEYPLILKGTPQQQEAERFREKVLDVSAYLGRLQDLAPIPEQPRPIQVAYHDACHLANAQGVKREPRKLLRAIPGLQLREITESHLCCGSAGTYNVDQPETAASLGRQKAEKIVATGAEIVVSGNIGCLTQLKMHLEQAGSTIEVRHTMQLLRDAYSHDLDSANA